MLFTLHHSLASGAPYLAASSPDVGSAPPKQKGRPKRPALSVLPTPYSVFKLPDIFHPILQIRLEVAHELARIRAIHNPVVEAQREPLNPTDRDRVVAILIGDHLGLFVQSPDAQDRRL